MRDMKRTTSHASTGAQSTSGSERRQSVRSTSAIDPKSRNGARSIMRVMTTTKNWTVVTSLVRRVVSDPAVKRSVCAKDRRCVREKSAFRRSFPTPVAARVET